MNKINKRKKRHLFTHTSLFLWLSILFIGSVLMGKSITGYFSHSTTLSTKQSANSDAKRIDELCKNSTSNDQCYAEAFYKLTQKNNSTYAVSALMGLQRIDPQRTTGCHFTAHKISQAETEKNPKNWEEIIKKVSPSMCTGGFLHGVLESHLATDPDFKIDEKSITHICGKILGGPNNWFAERSCSHNLGHLMLIQEEGKIQPAVKQCEKLVNTNYRYECLSGSFMERLTAENLFAHGLIKTRPNWNEKLAASTEELCSEYTGLANKACWKELSYVYFAISNSDPLGLHEKCQRAPTKDTQDECYIYGAGNMVTGSNFKSSNLMTLCHQFDLSNPLFKRCIDQTIGALLTSSTENITKTLNMCSKTYEPFKPNCYSRIAYFLTLNKAPQSVINNACLQIPDNLHLQLCRG